MAGASFASKALGAVGGAILDILLNPTDTSDEPKVTYIYRSGTGNNTNMTPRPDIDYTGLSYYLTPPPTGPYTVTSIEAVNETVVLRAVIDKPGHVAVAPANMAELPGWMDTRANALSLPHPYTNIIQSISARLRQ